MNPNHRSTGTTRTRLAAVLSALALAVTGMLATATAPAGAQEAPPEGLTWQVSTHAWTSSSLAPAHDTGAPAVKTDDGFSFPETTEATYDPATGIGRFDFPGHLDLGNLVQGNYRIRIAEPSLVLNGDGTGELTADVSYALYQEGAHVWSTPVRATTAELTIPEGAITDDGERISFTVTPDWPERTDVDPNPDGWRQFPQPFLDALAPAVPSLLGHFRETGGGAAGQPAKAPAPLSVDVAYDAPVTPDPDADLVRALYRTVLGRGVGDADLAFWVGQLDVGRSPYAVASAIASSPEARTRLVRSAYLDVLDRPGDAAGVAHWSDWLARGNAPESLVAHLLASPESWSRHGATNSGLATAAYDVYLRRTPDPGGLTYWTDRLDRSARHPVMLAFGRTPAATQRGVARAVDAACVGTTHPNETQLGALTTTWAATGRNPLRTAGVAVVLLCPDLVDVV